MQAACLGRAPSESHLPRTSQEGKPWLGTLPPRLGGMPSTPTMSRDVSGEAFFYQDTSITPRSRWLLLHVPESHGHGRDAESLHQRRMLRIERPHLVDDRRILLLGVGRDLSNIVRRNL